MQMYKGLPIITNKIPEHERNSIPHHLIDFIGLEEVPWTVTQFVREAQRIASEIRGRGRLPILVGGTHYYTQALLFRDSLVEKKENGDVNGNGKHDQIEWPILNASTEEMYTKLEELDPVIAGRWHPNDRRKIRRSLEICLQTGRKASDVYEEQKRQMGSTSGDANNNNESGSEETTRPCEDLRYSPLIFWLHSQEDALKARLNARVGTMVTNGLIEEASRMSDFNSNQSLKGLPLNLDKGIWVSIGYKEMQPLFAAMQDDDCGRDNLLRIQDGCIEAVMAHTRQYSKRQNRWIRLTLMDFLAKASSLDRLFLLDCTDPEIWTETVSGPSEQIAGAFIAGDTLPEPSSISSLAAETLAGRPLGKPDFVSRKCSMCNKVIMTEHEWDLHLKSSGHKKVVQGQRTRAENERRREAAAVARQDAVIGNVPVLKGESMASQVE